MYDSLAPDYDRFVNWSERLAFEMPFLEAQLQKVSTAKGSRLKVLDAACGTGQHAIALACAGYAVSGSDLSLQMIEKARENAQSADVTVNFKGGAFGSLEQVFTASEFDAVLCLGNSLPHVLTASDLYKTLVDFKRCLRPRGLLLIQNLNFDAVMQKQMRWMAPQSYHDSQMEYLFLRFYDFEANGLIRFNIVTLKRRPQEDWTSSIASTFLAPQLSSEMVISLKEAGYEKIHLYGSMTGEAYLPLSSENLVITALVAAD